MQALRSLRAVSWAGDHWKPLQASRDEGLFVARVLVSCKYYVTRSSGSRRAAAAAAATQDTATQKALSAPGAGVLRPAHRGLQRAGA